MVFGQNRPQKPKMRKIAHIGVEIQVMEQLLANFEKILSGGFSGATISKLLVSEF